MASTDRHNRVVHPNGLLVGVIVAALGIHSIVDVHAQPPEHPPAPPDSIPRLYDALRDYLAYQCTVAAVGRNTQMVLHVSSDIDQATVLQGAIAGISQTGTIVFIANKQTLKESWSIDLRVSTIPSEREEGDSSTSHVVRLETLLTMVDQDGRVVAHDRRILAAVVAGSLIRNLPPNEEPPSFIEKLLVPLVIVGAVGTTVFLLFHVRS